MKCVFCETSSEDEQLGEMLQIPEEICSLPRRRFHTHCLLYSSDIRQNADHTQGYYGFEEKNITFALQRARKRTCTFCKKKKASIQCKGRYCRKRFHLPCALASRETLHLHFLAFQSYCSKHISIECIFDCEPLTGIFSPFPCCNKVYSHGDCIKKYAVAVEIKAQFKCPYCNNVDEFRTFVETYLKRDILKDTPEALPSDFGFDAQCGADICLCEREEGEGRFGHDEGGGDFELIGCYYCDNHTHLICSQVRIDQKNEWTCKTCTITEVFEPNNSVERMKTRSSKRKQSKSKMKILSGPLTRKRVEANCRSEKKTIRT